MENNQTNGLTEELLKQFALQECFKLFPTSSSVNEFTEMYKRKLFRCKLKYLLELLGTLHHYPFYESHRLEKALGQYMVESGISKKERLKVNELMSLHTQLAIRIGTINNLIGDTARYYSARYDEVDQLISVEEEK